MDCRVCCIYFSKQKTAYKMRIIDWSTDMCSSDLQQLPSALPGIFESQPKAVPLATLSRTFDQLDALSAAGNAEAVCALARALIGQPEDQPTETFGEPVKAAIISAIKTGAAIKPAAAVQLQGAI